MPEFEDDKDDMENKYVEAGSLGLSTATSVSDRDGRQDVPFEQLVFQHLVLH